MARVEHRAGLFPALLKHWRGKRGLSQLDLALGSEVSSRHISFLETGRSRPSAEMVVRLATALDLPLRHVNTMLEAAGHPPLYPEMDPGPKGIAALPAPIVEALTLMKQHHEPFPLVVVDRLYRVLDLNRAAQALFYGILSDPAGAVAEELNLLTLTFDPEGARPAIVNFPEVGRALLWRLQREVLADPNDRSLRELLDQVLAMSTVSDDWREADLSVPSSPTLVLHLRAGELDLRFLTMITAFQAPQTVLLDELRIETWFPADTATGEACRMLAG
ncbi:MAG TPA: helix-turn-helix transcriptional regulator [Polyangiaceae bacterium LLY-WYZ-14_1]|nr:helix-turn-helix transcriptional regulator [Polyangiaceae bacterium LLY-WYZ-14_1]